MRALNTPWLPTTLIALLALGVLSSQLSVRHTDPSYFIYIGDRHVAIPAEVPRGVHIFPNSDGYDGQGYYQIALTLWPDLINAGLYLGNPPYRTQRILYPVLARIVSLNVPAFVPGAMVLVNFIGLCGLGWVGGRYAQLTDRHALWGSLFALYPGFLFTLTRDLTEIIASLFLMAALLALRLSSAQVWPTLWFTLAALSRETSVLAILALGAVLIAQRDYKRWMVVGIPLIVFGFWQSILWARWGVWPVLSGPPNFGWPVVGLATFLGSLDIQNAVQGVWLIEVLYLVALAAMAVWAIRSTTGPAANWHINLAWMGYGVLLLMLSRLVWVEDLAYMRAATEFYLLSLLLVLALPRPNLLLSLAVLTFLTETLVFFTRLDWRF